MGSKRRSPQFLVGPRRLGNRICRLLYVRETDEVWTEVWTDASWVRSEALVRHVLKAPVPTTATLARFGVPDERGEWDRETATA